MDEVLHKDARTPMHGLSGVPPLLLAGVDDDTDAEPEEPNIVRSID
ncbi:hypothetical protein [Streptomyces cavernicola]|uniref:Albusnodin family lasso peptide n=1 Tax=Streptomyces cavernicola TaxID=3043613 RepID=A0ABT6SJ51_9ACTN|nr:hypothetical protein [Streptomyces sp. B-S-A6]MDI3408227.1 hypothetical protein [Streptomyces sp. B-S-A6]